LGSILEFRGTVEVSKAAETADTALRPLTRSPASTAPFTKYQVFLFNCLGQLRTVRETSRRIHKFKIRDGGRQIRRGSYWQYCHSVDEA